MGAIMSILRGMAPAVGEWPAAQWDHADLKLEFICALVWN